MFVAIFPLICFGPMINMTYCPASRQPVKLKIRRYQLGHILSVSRSASATTTEGTQIRQYLITTSSRVYTKLNDRNEFGDSILISHQSLVTTLLKRLWCILTLKVLSWCCTHLSRYVSQNKKTKFSQSPILW